jgi:hypothetical protein
MSPNFAVLTVGTDSSARTIRMTRYMRDWWNGTCEELGYRPTIVQGAFMEGAGAKSSAGYHDKAGCLDLRVWDLTEDQQREVIRTTRRRGAGSWLRDEKHGGMDPHIHLVLGTDSPLHSGAEWQWTEYLAGRDGLTGRGKDYHWRPDPLVLKPPPVEPTPRWDAVWELARAIANSEEQEPDARTAARQIKELADPFSTKH